MKAFYCNDGFATDILFHGKTMETRNKNMLSQLVGERVEIIDTNRYQPGIVGSVELAKRFFMTMNGVFITIPTSIL